MCLIRLNNSCLNSLGSAAHDRSRARRTSGRAKHARQASSAHALLVVVGTALLGAVLARRTCSTAQYGVLQGEELHLEDQRMLPNVSNWPIRIPPVCSRTAGVSATACGADGAPVVRLWSARRGHVHRRGNLSSGANIYVTVFCEPVDTSPQLLNQLSSRSPRSFKSVYALLGSLSQEPQSIVLIMTDGATIYNPSPQSNVWSSRLGTNEPVKLRSKTTSWSSLSSPQLYDTEVNETSSVTPLSSDLLSSNSEDPPTTSYVPIAQKSRLLDHEQDQLYNNTSAAMTVSMGTPSDDQEHVNVPTEPNQALHSSLPRPLAAANHLAQWWRKHVRPWTGRRYHRRSSTSRKGHKAHAMRSRASVYNTRMARN